MNIKASHYPEAFSGDIKNKITTAAGAVCSLVSP